MVYPGYSQQPYIPNSWGRAPVYPGPAPWVNRLARPHFPQSPATQGLLPPLENMDPKALEALQGKMTPEMMQQAAQLMKDPRVRDQVGKIQEMIQNGQMTPEMMDQMVGQIPGMPPIGKMDVVGMAQTGLLACVMGLMLGKNLDYVMQGIHKQRNSLLERVLKGIEANVPGVNWLNNKLEQMIHQVRQNLPAHESALLRLDSAYTPEEVLKNYLSAYLGPQGHLYPQLQKLRLPAPLLQRLSTQVHNTAQLQQILDANPVHFLPPKVQNAAGVALENGFLQRNVIRPMKEIAEALMPSLTSASKASAVTLGYLQREMEKETFFKLLHDACDSAHPIRGITTDLVRETESLLMKPILGVKGVHDPFAYNFAKLSQNPASKAAKVIRCVLGVNSHTDYQGVRHALRLKAGNKTVVEFLRDASQGLVTHLNVSEKTTLAELQSHFKQYHLIERLNRGRTGSQLKSTLSGLLKRAQYFEKYNVPVVETEHALYQAFKNRGIGPVGRFLGKMGFYGQRILEGANFKRFGGKVLTETPSVFNRLLVSLFIFGFAISGYKKAPEESKIPQFFEHLASGLGGYLGYELGRQVVPGLGILTRIPFMARLNRMRGVGFAMSEFVIPMIIGGVLGYGSQKVANLVFGDPVKIERKLQFAADKERSLQSQKGLFEQFKNGESPQIPGITPNTEAFTPDETALTPENTGLTPEQIVVNPAKLQENAIVQHEAGHLKSFAHSLWDHS